MRLDERARMLRVGARLIVGSSVTLLLAAFALGAPEPSASQGERESFFEAKVRPLLVARCFRCHGERDPKGGIRLDSAEALLGKTPDEAVVQPGHPEKSRLMEVIGYKGEPKMPPDGKLPDADIETLREWIRRGAYFPSKEGGGSDLPLSSPLGIIRAQQTLWSLQPVTSPKPPKVSNQAWVKTPIDQFILARLEASGLGPSPAADRRTLLRRLSFDLVGLPPTYEEVLAFERDNSPEAVERVVDRLLASPFYGQRWGRHWLDVARYSDTKGYVFTEERRYPFSYTYRDYVIDAFNQDLPFDRFILEQLAADQLELGKDHSALAAMGFLTVGRRFSNNINDIIDDRIDVVSRGLLGLSVTCARCHDHKFDPIPTDDYYSLYGVFASATEPAELPLLTGLPQTEAYRKFETDMHRLQEARKQFESTKLVEVQDQTRLKVAEYLQAAWDNRKKDATLDRKALDSRGLRALLVRRWAIFLNRTDASPDPVFRPWHEFAAIPDNDFAARSTELIARLKQTSTTPDPARSVNRLVRETFVHAPPKSMRDVIARYGTLLVEAERRWKKLLEESPADKRPSALSDRDWEELRQVLYREGSPALIAADDLKRVLDRASRNQLVKLTNKIEALRANSPAAPPRGMVLADLPAAVEPVVFIRGNPGRPGKQVPRRFLQAVRVDGPIAFTIGSGRLELAEAIANPRNPLTARVIVNRVWMHHFGAGIVRTASDFGVRGSAPTHPELLDYLASRFMREGWSIKKLHRQIVLSAVYQQASVLRRDEEEKDPENKLLWRKSPSRLEFEPMRDSWLAVAGNLDLRMGGRGFDIQEAAGRGRRSVYAFIDRQDLPQLFRTFDFASPDVSTAQRPQTTIPQQALFSLNSPLLLAQARALTRSIAANDATERVRRLYRRILARDPSDAELHLAVAFANNPNSDDIPDDVASTWHYGYGTLDVEGKRVQSFNDFPRFVDQRWGGAKLPDATLGWVHLTARGGHPGGDLQHCAIRRWVSPVAGEIVIRGTLEHPSPDGDGIRGWIISSRQGCLKEWTLKHGKQPTAIDSVDVQPGETLDFVVDCRDSDNSDGFGWAPVIKTKQVAGSPKNVVQLWHAANDFSGPGPPRLSAWEQLAQALLVSNEFVFID